MEMVALNLLVLRARDPEGLAEYYAAFGLKFSQERHGRGPVHHSCHTNGSVFEIYPRKTRQPSTKHTRLGFRVASIETVLDRIGHLGAVVSPPADTDWGRRAVLQDPEGHKVELLESGEPAKL